MRKLRFHDWLIVIYEHTANPMMRTVSGQGELSQAIVGVPSINASNKENVRTKLEKHFRLEGEDGVVLVGPDQSVQSELQALKTRHEFVMNLIPQKVFLSHKGVDKPLVRDFYLCLQLLGFDPWLDEDAMVAGVELERGLLKGFNDFCAAVFFVTPNFIDEKYLATEVNYAIAEKRNKGDRICDNNAAFSENGKKGSVPHLLRTYIYKEPASQLEALREILRAMPLAVGQVRWRIGT